MPFGARLKGRDMTKQPEAKVAQSAPEKFEGSDKLQIIRILNLKFVAANELEACVVASSLSSDDVPFTQEGLTISTTDEAGITKAVKAVKTEGFTIQQVGEMLKDHKLQIVAVGTLVKSPKEKKERKSPPRETLSEAEKLCGAEARQTLKLKPSGKLPEAKEADWKKLRDELLAKMTETQKTFLKQARVNLKQYDVPQKGVLGAHRKAVMDECEKLAKAAAKANAKP